MTDKRETYTVKMAPHNTDVEWAEFMTRTWSGTAANRDDAILRAALNSGISSFESGDYTVVSVEVVPAPGPKQPGCEYTSPLSAVDTQVECARRGCELCQGELDIAMDDSWMEEA